MGFSITWFGFENKTKAEALAKFGQRDSGIADDGNEALFSAAQLPTGWTIVFVNDFAVGGEAALLEELSQSGRIVACQIEEHAMISAARGYQDEREKWEVVHDSHRGVYDVSTQGQPPKRSRTFTGGSPPSRPPNRKRVGGPIIFSTFPSNSRPRKRAIATTVRSSPGARLGLPPASASADRRVIATGVFPSSRLNRGLRGWGVRQDHIPRGRTIPMGAVPVLARGLGYTAPTYSRRRPGSPSNGLLGSAL